LWSRPDRPITALLLEPQSGEETRGVSKNARLNWRQSCHGHNEAYTSAEADAADAVKRPRLYWQGKKQCRLQKKGAFGNRRTKSKMALQLKVMRVL